jgi:hypothetical protein
MGSILPDNPETFWINLTRPQPSMRSKSDFAILEIHPGRLFVQVGLFDKKLYVFPESDQKSLVIKRWNYWWSIDHSSFEPSPPFYMTTWFSDQLEDALQRNGFPVYAGTWREMWQMTYWK